MQAKTERHVLVENVQKIVPDQVETIDFWLPEPGFTQNSDPSQQFPDIASARWLKPYLEIGSDQAGG